MNFESINYILETAKHHNISKAAKSLHITQQTLSAHILSVEREIGTPLFIRHTPLEITYAGQQFIKFATPIQGQIQTLHQVLNQVANQEQFRLRIGIADNRDRILLSPIISDFQLKFPNAEIKIIENPNEVLIRELMENRLDLCISDFSLQTTSINQADLYRERVVFVIPKKLFLEKYETNDQTIINKINAESAYHYLADFPILLGDGHDISGKFARKVLATFSSHPQIKVEAENMGLILELVADGLGGCFCPEIIVKNTLTSKQQANCFCIPLGKKAEYTIQIGWKNDWAPITSFVESAQRNVPHQPFNVQ